MTSLEKFIAELAASDGQPVRSYAALERLSADRVGMRLFTLTTVDRNAGVGCRFYSNMPDAYPPSGRKPIPENDWGRTVIERRQVFVANDIVSIAKVFPDHELIRSLGCESAMTVPVVVNGELLGTINCLDSAGAYTGQRVERAADLALPGAACFLLERSMANSGESS